MNAPLMLTTAAIVIAANRESVLADFNAAKKANYVRFINNRDDRATSEYIYENQMIDAHNIIDEFYKNGKRVVSISKKTKVGADGLMIMIAMLFCTHSDDSFVIDPANMYILTGMSNKSWETDMKEKAPNCIKNKIYHHGQLKHADLHQLKNSVFIIDEIDTGDKIGQLLPNTLKEAGVLDVRYMEENNIRFVFVSATMIRELHELYRWGNLHTLYKMTIPESYIGHIDFLRLGIIQECYALNNDDNAMRWIKEDILDYYGAEYRVHIVRVSEKTIDFVKNACIRNSIPYKNHTSIDRLTPELENELFRQPLQSPVVVLVKGLLRRANLIPNSWKLRIGAIHELFTGNPDYNVHIQALAGRMTGYWKPIVVGGHKTGPYRTSIVAVEQYEKSYENPFGNFTYSTDGFKKKKNGRITSDPTMLSPSNIANLDAIDQLGAGSVINPDSYRVYDTEEKIKNACKILGYNYRSCTKFNENGFIETSLNKTHYVASLDDAIKKVPTAYGGGGSIKYRTSYPCYVDVTDKSTLRFVLIIRPGTDPVKLAQVDEQYPRCA